MCSLLAARVKWSSCATLRKNFRRRKSIHVCLYAYRLTSSIISTLPYYRFRHMFYPADTARIGENPPMAAGLEDEH